MAKGKLILICQSGGEFMTKDDGTLSYTGGEANAINIKPESLFDDLKFKLAEICNLEYKSVSIKYFLPGNRRNLITLKNDKDLKRMFDFHGNSITADIFVTGSEGFDREGIDIHVNRGNGIEPAETVNHVDLATTAANTSQAKRKIVTIDRNISPTKSTPRVTTTAGNSSRAKRKSVATDRNILHVEITTADSVVAVDATADSPPASPPSSDHVTTGYDSDYAPRAAVPKSHSPVEIDVTATPADTVKKRRRTASWKIGTNGPTIVSVTDDAEKTRSRKKITQNDGALILAGDVEKNQDSSNQKPKDVGKRSISRDLGIELHNTQVQIEESYKEAYNHLPWFCEKIVDSNPGSFANLITNDEKIFQRLFVAFNASICGFQNNCRPILFLESNSLKSKFQEILLTATAIDGNDGLFPVAFAIIDIENEDNWRWFLEQLKSSISISESITFVSDKEKNLKQSVLEVFENAHYGYSMYHLIESFKKNSKGPFHGDGKASLPGNLLGAAHSVRFGGFKKFTEQIKHISSQAYDWVMQVEPENWTSLSFKGERYNQITQDVADPYISLMRESRDLLVTNKVEYLIRMMANLMNNRQSDATNWSTKLTPLRERQLQDEALNARGLKVFISSDTLFEVRDDSSHVVNIGNWDCTCLGWKQTGMPCCHAIAVFNSTGRSAYDYCSQYFTVDNFRLTYSESINPIRLVDKPVEKEEGDKTVVVLPPCPSGPPVEDEDDRIEKEREKKRTVTCQRCKEPGHNKASCKVILPV